MRWLVRTLGWAQVGLGVLIALYPFLSVWRVSGQVLDELPLIEETVTVDQTNRFGTAVFDGDFLLATRVYEERSVEDVERALAGKGFERTGFGEDLWWVKECCGEYDAVMVRVTAEEPGGTLANVTVFDSDIQASWFFFLFFGSIPLLPGLLLLSSQRSTSRPDDRELAAV